MSELEDIFHMLEKEMVGTDNVTIDFRETRKGKPYCSGRYFSGANILPPRVVITLGTNPIDNIGTMIHELTHHFAYVNWPTYYRTHGPEFWYKFWQFAMQYDARIPGIVSSRLQRYCGNGGYNEPLRQAMRLRVPGAIDYYNSYVREIEDYNRNIRRQRERYAARTTPVIAKKLFESLEG